MRAMQIIEWGKPLEPRDYPTPQPAGEEVLVRVESAGACHTEQVLQQSGGGVAGAIDFVGSPKTMEFGIGALRKGGKLVMVGRQKQRSHGEGPRPARRRDSVNS